VAIVYPLIQGRNLGWPAWTYVSMGASLALFAGLAVHLRHRKRTGRDPVIEPSIFSHRGYSAGALVMMLFFGGMVGSMLAITLFLQLGEGFSAIHAGLTLAPFALGTAITAPLAAQKMNAISGRLLIQIGGLVALCGYSAVAVILGSSGHISTWGLLGPLLVVGMGMGLFVVPVFDTIIAAVTDAEIGSASGVLNAIQQLGGAIGVAVLGTIFFTVLRHQGFAAALRHTMWWQVGLMGLMLAISPLLPRRARETAYAAQAEGEVEGEVETEGESAAGTSAPVAQTAAAA
jgi:MFS family permease